jgi:FlaA1/EpsC-like NDP-sugar epimerase
MNILITGGTGFLGRHIIGKCLDMGHNVTSLSHSEKREKEVHLQYPSVDFYSLDISHNKDILDSVIKKHAIDYIIHTAAMKYIGICENNPTRSIEVNIDGSRNIINAAKKNNVKNVIAISTDKAINPTSVYGSTKFLMEKLMLENNFSVIQGVNFFFSTGSVLDLWETCKNEGKEIGVNTENTIRYFVNANDVADKILDNLNTKGSYIYLDECYQVSLHDLSLAFCEYHGYYNTKEYVSISAEKTIEEVPGTMVIHDADVETIKSLLEKYYEEEK